MYRACSASMRRAKAVSETAALISRAMEVWRERRFFSWCEGEGVDERAGCWCGEKGGGVAAGGLEKK